MMMKIRLNIWKPSYLILIILFLLFESCYIFNYAEAINEEVYAKKIANRKFINSLKFTGIVKDKILTDGELKYRLLIGNYMNIAINSSFSETSQYSYYSFYSYKDKLLDIAVTKDLFNMSSIGDVICKISDNDTVMVHDRKILFYDW